MEPAPKKLHLEPGVVSGQPWVEKYRPRSLDDVQSQEEVVAALRRVLSAGANMPHMLFHGPAGTGKTSAVLAVARQLFGPDYTAARVRELNASDERGIQVVREKVKRFAQGSATAAPAKVQSDGHVYPVPGFKLIVLDEADALLPDAQAALRRMMEDYSDVTRFCILCNYVSRIIDPIASRCAKFRFKPIPTGAMHHRLQAIAATEGIALTDEAVTRLGDVSGGDMRLAITTLQSAARAHSGLVHPDHFDAAAGVIPGPRFAAYLAALPQGVPRLVAATEAILREGYAATQIMRQLQQHIVGPECRLSTAGRAAVCLKLAQVERRLADRGDDLLQLLDLGASVAAAA